MPDEYPRTREGAAQLRRPFWLRVVFVRRERLAGLEDRAQEFAGERFAVLGDRLRRPFGDDLAAAMAALGHLAMTCGSCRHSMIACRAFSALTRSNQWLRVPTVARPLASANTSCCRSGNAAFRSSNVGKTPDHVARSVCTPRQSLLYACLILVWQRPTWG